LLLETDLMISDPNFFFDEFVEAGSDSFIVHWEVMTVNPGSGINTLSTRSWRRSNACGALFSKYGLNVNSNWMAELMRPRLPWAWRRARTCWWLGPLSLGPVRGSKRPCVG
jgi:hypothetical protein